MSDTAPAIVEHVSKTHTRITPAPGWSVVIFNCGTSSVDAVVVSDDGSETIRLRVAPPKVGQALSVKINEDRGVDLNYAEAVDGY